jgi:hypothetical protein
MSDVHAVRTDPALAQGPLDSRKAQSPPRNLRVLLLLADAGLAEAFFLSTLLLTRVRPESIALKGGASGPALPILLGVLFPVILASRGLYRLNRYPSWRGQAAAGVRAVLWSIGISVGVLFLFAREIPWSLRAVLTLYHVMLGIWMVAVRPLLTVLVQMRAAARTPARRALLVGADGAAVEIARALAREPGCMQVVGFADETRSVGGRVEPYFQTSLHEIPELARDLAADLVVLARSDLPREEVVRMGDRLSAQGTRVHIACNVFNRLIDSIPFENLGGVPLLPIGQTPLQGTAARIKRVFDLFAAGVGGILILPLLLLIALLPADTHRTRGPTLRLLQIPLHAGG